MLPIPFAVILMNRVYLQVNIQNTGIQTIDIIHYIYVFRQLKIIVRHADLQYWYIV